MKKYVMFLFIMVMGVVPCAFSQVAKIVDMNGRVQVKKTPDDRWRRPRLDMYLDKEAEIKTGRNSDCTIAFDEELKNILTIKENSSIAIESIAPGKVYLPRGRVFSLIEDLAKVQEFEVRTPVAIAGVRGTGDSVDTDGTSTTVKCFEGLVGVTDTGYFGQSSELGGGSGITIGPGGKGDPFDLSEADYDEWDDFRDYGDEIREDIFEGTDSRDPFQQLQNEQRDGFKEDYFEELRRENKEEEGGRQSCPECVY